MFILRTSVTATSVLLHTKIVTLGIVSFSKSGPVTSGVDPIGSVFGGLFKGDGKDDSAHKLKRKENRIWPRLTRISDASSKGKIVK
ncbi:LOW QUALITY PROTEIN: hypothetical protein V1477_005358 [Vespula maculifrons]|uniref:Uncharacterized protein n=1 Tax=Vespula maculifrons TaxID=7453 RepID=A0ABD2CS28_VESMC